MENRESRDLKSLPLDLLKEKMTELSEKPFRAKQLYDWMHVKLAGDYDEMTNLSAAFRNRLKEEYPLTTLRVVREQTSAIDGTKKFYSRCRTEIWWRVCGCSISMAIQFVFPLRLAAGWAAAFARLRWTVWNGD